MKVLLDTNVLLDILEKREPYINRKQRLQEL